MMKRLLSTLLVVSAMALLVTACGGGTDDSEDLGGSGDLLDGVSEVSEVTDAAPDIGPDLDEEDLLDLFVPDEVGTDMVEIVDVVDDADQTPPEETVDETDEELPPPDPTDVGKACVTDLDCDTDAGCFLGFCTAFCKAGGELLPGACDTPSLESIWGDHFECPADMNVCMPGAVGGKELVCSLDADCEDQGLVDFACAGTFPNTQIEVAGRCLPVFDRKGLGATCLESGDGCASLMCAHPNMDEDLNGICTAYCNIETPCPEDSVCSMSPVFEEDGELMGYAPVCVPFKGSVADCTDDPSVCKIGKEFCEVVFLPETYEAGHVCVESTDVTGGFMDESCSANNPCFGGWCAFQDWSNKLSAYCTLPCQDDSECAEGMACRTTQVAPGEGLLPYGLFSAKFCMRVTEGAPCFLGEENNCQYEWSECVALAGVVGLGTCVDGECPPDCAGKACGEDDGCGNACLDACLDKGQPCTLGTECLSDFCADGVCCDSACDGTCEACNGEASAGTCLPYNLGSDPEAECGTCFACDGQGECAIYGVGMDPDDECGLCQVCSDAGECVPAPLDEDPEGECGTCQLCNGEGACAPVAYGLDPKEECEETEPLTCLTTGVCNGEGACEMFGAETVCGDATCVGSVYTPAPACDGAGVCQPAQGENCMPYVCDEEAAVCLAACTETADCASNHWCVDGACEALPACPLETKLLCNVTVPGTTNGLANDWSGYGCVPGVPYDGPDRVYSIKQEKATRITISITDNAFDAALFLLADACAPDLSCVNFSDLFPAGSGETLSFDAQAGKQYHFAVDGFADTDFGTYQIQADCCELQCAAENACGDDGCGGSCGTCGDAEVCSAGLCLACEDDLGGEPNDTCGEAAPLLPGANEGLLLCPEGDMDWYSVEAEAGQTLTLLLEFDEGAANLDMALYGPGCDLFVADSTSPDGEEVIETLIKEAGTYTVLVYSPAAQQAGYSLVADLAEPECVTDDDCANPMEVCGLYQCVVPPPACAFNGEPVCSAFIAGDTTGKGANLTDYTACGATLAGSEDIYKLIFPEETVVTVTLSGMAFTAGLAVLEQYCAADWACITASVSEAPGNPLQVTFKATAGKVYWLIVDGVGAEDVGTYSFSVDCCAPQCDGKVCGDDGCGMTCGDCPGDQDACVEGQCVCQPTCEGKMCGDDGCGGDCGECPGEQDACVDNQCVCQPACDGKQCGDDGCGGSCGECEGPQDLCEEFQCVCQPACDGKECGDDGCGGLCGECQGPQDLCTEEGLCVCQPTCDGKECGDDGCGGSCGECQGPQDLCEEFQCVCQPDCEGKACGDDGCGGQCGTCPATDQCIDFQCVCSNDYGYEPNDTCVAATPVEAATYPDLAICLGGDQDWYQFEIPAGATLTVDVLFDHEAGDLDAYLYKQGNCVGYLASASSSNDNETLVYSSTTTSIYLLRVVAFSPSVANLYTLEITLD